VITSTVPSSSRAGSWYVSDCRRRRHQGDVLARQHRVNLALPGPKFIEAEDVAENRVGRSGSGRGVVGQWRRVVGDRPEPGGDNVSLLQVPPTRNQRAATTMGSGRLLLDRLSSATVHGVVRPGLVVTRATSAALTADLLPKFDRT
jgi:hypothetical protein